MGRPRVEHSVAFEDETDLELNELQQDLEDLELFEPPLGNRTPSWHELVDLKGRVAIHLGKPHPEYVVYVVEDSKGRPASYAARTRMKWACAVLCPGQKCEFNDGRQPIQVDEETKELTVMKLREDLLQGEIAHIDSHLQTVREIMNYLFDEKESMVLRQREVKRRSDRLLTAYFVASNNDFDLDDEHESTLDRFQQDVRDLRILEGPEDRKLKLLKVRDVEGKPTRYAIKAGGKWACVLWHRGENCEFNQDRELPHTREEDKDLLVMNYSKDFFHGEIKHIDAHLDELHRTLDELKDIKKTMKRRRNLIRRRCKPLTRRLMEIRSSRKKTQERQSDSMNPLALKRTISKRKCMKSILKKTGNATSGQSSVNSHMS